MTATVRSSHLFASDLPTASEIQEDASGTLWLRRRLTGHWQRDPRAKEAFQREIEANSRIPLGSPSLVPLRSAGDAPELWLSREYFPCGPLYRTLGRVPAAVFPAAGTGTTAQIPRQAANDATVGKQIGRAHV